MEVVSSSFGDGRNEMEMENQIGVASQYKPT